MSDVVLDAEKPGWEIICQVVTDRPCAGQLFECDGVDGGLDGGGIWSLGVCLRGERREEKCLMKGKGKKEVEP